MGRGATLTTAAKAWPTVHGNTGNNGPTGTELGRAVAKDWPTPQNFDAQDFSRSPEALARAKTKGGCHNLREWVHAGPPAPANPSTNGKPPDWPTPVANDDNKSPEAHMAMKQRMKGGPRQTITSLQVMAKTTGPKGSLNPDWVQQLMGYPDGWLDVNASTDSKPSATPSSRRSSK